MSDSIGRLAEFTSVTIGLARRSVTNRAEPRPNLFNVMLALRLEPRAKSGSLSLTTTNLVRLQAAALSRV